MNIGRRSLGLGIADDRVSAVLLVGGSVRWAASRRLDPDAPLGHALRALLAACPRRGILPVTVTAAFGPSVSQLRCLTGLPPIGQPRALAAMVRENAGRFFVRNGVALTISEALIEGRARVWIAAFDAPVVAEVAGACRDVGLSLRYVIPTAMALRRAIRGGSVTWKDGRVQLSITYGAAGPLSVRRMPVAEHASAFPQLIDALSSLESSPDAVDAAGAALSCGHDTVVARPAAAVPDVGSRRRARRIAGAACLSAISVALLSPGAATSVALHRDRARATLIAARAGTAEHDLSKLARVSTALRALSDLSASRQSMTLLLAEVTRGLPDSAALVAFQVDSSGLASVVALAPHAAAVVDAVERMPGIASPQIIGPVTRESAGGRTIERVTVQFRLLPARVP
ncbi:MAG TPA: hypothetical protein VFW04_12410 [Gemmatimonadaceae bacterium]|nr:hypothetical protein [Gemmatimonadaceae bacterium]